MLKNNRFNMILALVAAIVLWAYVLGEINPSSSTVVRNVPINFINEEALEEEGLALLSSSATTVNISISGQRTAITRVDAGDFNVTVDLEALKKGENTVRVNVTGPSSVKIDRTSIEKVNVVVDEKISAEKDIDTIIKGDVPNDKEATVINVDRNKASVSGPKTLVDRVVKLVAYIDAEDMGNEAKDFTVNMIPIDANGEKVEGLTLEGGSEVNITAIMFSKKTVQLHVPITNQDSGDIERDITIPNTVVIKGSEEDLSEVSRITCRGIDLRNVTTSTSITLEPILPEGVEIVDSSDTLVMTVKVKEQISKTFDFSNSDIAFNGKDNNYNYKVSDVEVKVTVKGKESVIDGLTKEDFTLSVNVADLDAGKHMLDVKVICREDNLNIELSPAKVEVVIE